MKRNGVWTWKEGVQDQCVSKDLDTLLTAPDVLIDDHVVPPAAPVVAATRTSPTANFFVYHRERRWIRHVHSDPQWRAMFPYLPKQSGYHKRPEERRTVTTQSDPDPGGPSWFDGLWIVCNSGLGHVNPHEIAWGFV